MILLSPQRIWDWYALGYGVLGRLVPYQHMMLDIKKALPLKYGDQFLDAGCGVGALISAMSKGTSMAIGMDLSQSMLCRAKRTCLNVSFVRSSLDGSLPFRDSSFDQVSCVNVLYALQNPDATLREFIRVLRPGARFVLVNPKASVSPLLIIATHLKALNRWSDRLRSIRYLPPLIWVGICTAWLLAGNRRSQWFFPSAEELHSMLDQIGFTGIQIIETYADQAWLVTGWKA